MINKPLEYNRRKENVKEVNLAILQLEGYIKESIRNLAHTSNDVEIFKLNEQIKINTKLLAGLVIIWSENSIKWLLYEHGAFQDEQIFKILNTPALKDKWTIALTNAFYFTYPVNTYDATNPLVRKSHINSSTSIHTKDKEKYSKLRDIIETNLSDAIDIRNKIQHGDWANSYKVNEVTKEYEFDPTQTNIILNENLLILKLKRRQFKLIYDLIKDLAVFKNRGSFKLDNNSTPFTFFFGKRYGQILVLQKTIDQANFEQYKEQIITRIKRGVKWKKKNSRLFIKCLKGINKRVNNYRQSSRRP